MFTTEAVVKQTIDLMFKHQPGSHNGVLITSVPGNRCTSYSKRLGSLKLITFTLTS
jgi:hypothetical protein